MSDVLTVTDGTTAEINRALTLARRYPQKHIINPRGKIGGSLYSQTQPEVTIRGESKLDGPLELYGVDRIHFNGAMFDCSEIEAFAIEGKQSWKLDIRGCASFNGCNEGGIRLNSGKFMNNLAAGQIHISGVSFAKCKGVAADIQCRSSTVIFDRCLFDLCGQVARNRMCDDLNFRDCRVIPANPKENDWACIEHNYGKLTIEGGIWTPPWVARDMLGLSWVVMKDCPYTDEFMFVADKTRFGGEFGGMAVVRCSQAGRNPPSGPLTSAGVSIRLRDLNCYNHPSEGEWKTGEPTVGLILIDKLPNLISVHDCVGNVRGPIVQRTPDSPEDFAGGLKLGDARGPGMISIGPNTLVPNGGAKNGEVVDAELLPWLVV